jgi:hypothetical protein
MVVQGETGVQAVKVGRVVPGAWARTAVQAGKVAMVEAAGVAEPESKSSRPRLVWKQNASR